MKAKTETSDVSWAALIISIIAFVILLLLFIIAIIFINNILTHGVPVTIMFGGSLDIRSNFDTSKFTTFISKAAGATIKILSSGSNISGKILRLRNTNDAAITIDTSQLRSFDGGNIPNPKTIAGRHLASFLFTGKNELLRMS